MLAGGLTPTRVLVFAVWAVAVFVLVAAIAGVARAQVRKGANFQFATAPAATQVAADRDDSSTVAQLGSVGAARGSYATR